jgi:hypothetical protein
MYYELIIFNHRTNELELRWSFLILLSALNRSVNDQILDRLQILFFNLYCKILMICYRFIQIELHHHQCSSDH